MLQIEEYNKELEIKRDSLKNGPIANRSVTDCFCCLVFLVAVIGFIAVSAYGWHKGDPAKLLIGWDSDRNGCGYTAGFEDYPYLYWPSNPASDLKEAIESLDVDKAISLLNKGTCVKECPTSKKSEPVNCKPTTA